MTRYRSHSAMFKRQVAEEFIADETPHALPKRHDISWQLIQIWIGEFEAGALESDVQAAGLQHTHRAEHRVLADVQSAVQRQQTEVFRLSCKRDVAAARAFYRKAIKDQG
jgi:transposase